MNAKEELVLHLERNNLLEKVEYVKVATFDREVEGTLKEVMKKLDFVYDDRFGGQELFGFVLYKDGRWSERWGYDGAEVWTLKTCPDKDTPVDTGW